MNSNAGASRKNIKIQNIIFNLVPKLRLGNQLSLLIKNKKITFNLMAVTPEYENYKRGETG